jgi:iron complex transport system ATP-binding protein
MLLSAKDISVSYGPRQVLRSVSLDLAPGQLIAILGPNGCGKTTLLKSLLNLIPSTGSIAWNDKPLRNWSRRALARTVAYLPQSPTYDPAQTVSDILRLGRAPYWQILGLESTHDLDIIQNTAQLLDLTDLLNEPIDNLSGGQRQRIFIARCLVQEPSALLLDEPDTFLDLKHQSALYQLLRKLTREKNLAVIVASHDLNLAAAHADGLILLDAGAIAASGTASDVLQPDLIAKVYGIAMERIDRAGVVSILPATAP